MIGNGVGKVCTK